MKNINVNINLYNANMDMNKLMDDAVSAIIDQQKIVEESNNKIKESEENIRKSIGLVNLYKSMLLKQIRTLTQQKDDYEKLLIETEEEGLSYFMEISDMTDELKALEEILADQNDKVKEKKERMTCKKKLVNEIEAIKIELQVYYNIKLKDGVWQPAIIERVKELETQKEELEKILKNN